MTMTTSKERASSGRGAPDRDRFYVRKDKWADFQALGRGGDSPFTTMKDVFIVAAALGYRSGRGQPLGTSRQNIGLWQFFSAQEDVPLLQAIAVASTGDVAVLADQGEILKIAEEYANVGIDLLMQDVRSEVGAT